MNTRKLNSFTLLLMVFFLIAAPVTHFNRAVAASPEQTVQPTHSLELIAQFGGTFKAIAAQDPYVYAAVGPRLQVIDVSVPDNPQLTGQTETFPEEINDMVVQGTKVYASIGEHRKVWMGDPEPDPAGTGGLLIFDVSDPAKPVKVGQIQTARPTKMVFVHGDYAYLRMYQSIEIIDVSKPDAPQAVGSYPGRASDIAFQGSMMFVAFGDKISILDINTPSSPSLVLDYNVPADELELEGNTLYVGDTKSYQMIWTYYYGVLRILDITNLQNIQQLYFSGDTYTSPVPAQLRDMKLLDGRLYSYGVTCGRPSSPCDISYGGIDVSNPTNPSLNYKELYKTAPNIPYWGDSAVSGSHIFVMTKETLSIYYKYGTAEIGRFYTLLADEVIVEDNIAFVAARAGGLVVMDVSDPAHPLVSGTYTTTIEGSADKQGRISHIAVYGPYVYARVGPLVAGWGFNRLDILKATDHKNIIRYSDAIWWTLPVRIHNGIGYYFLENNNENRLVGIDLSDPIQPVDTGGSVVTTQDNRSLSLWGTYAYIGSQNGLQIVNVANPKEFVDVKKLDYPTPAYLTETSQGSLYAFTDQALKVYNLSDPINPKETSSTPVANLGEPVDMEVQNGDVYMIQSGSAVRVFHLENTSSQAIELASYARGGVNFSSMDVADDLVFVSAGENGLFIFRHTVTSPNLTERVYLPFSGNRASLQADCDVRYSTYLENSGWLDWAVDDEESGFPDQGPGVVDFEVQLCNGWPEDMRIVYQAYVQGVGWTDWVYNGPTTGSIVPSNRLEAVRMSLVNAPTYYDISYSVYMEGTGWVSTSYETQGVAGIIGQGKHIEAIRINIGK